MTSSRQTNTQAGEVDSLRLRCPGSLWAEVIAELRRRGEDQRESGAFLLGRIDPGQRAISRVIYYDDLAPGCLSTGFVVLPGACFGRLWEQCRVAKLEVVADVHTHPFGSRQSLIDQANPMIALPGHVALIVPDFARGDPSSDNLGIYEYLGEHRWRNHSGPRAPITFTFDEDDT